MLLYGIAVSATGVHCHRRSTAAVNPKFILLLIYCVIHSVLVGLAVGLIHHRSVLLFAPYTGIQYMVGELRNR